MSKSKSHSTPLVHVPAKCLNMGPVEYPLISCICTVEVGWGFKLLTRNLYLDIWIPRLHYNYDHPLLAVEGYWLNLTSTKSAYFGTANLRVFCAKASNILVVFRHIRDIQTRMLLYTFLITHNGFSCDVQLFQYWPTSTEEGCQIKLKSSNYHCLSYVLSDL